MITIDTWILKRRNMFHGNISPETTIWIEGELTVAQTSFIGTSSVSWIEFNTFFKCLCKYQNLFALKKVMINPNLIKIFLRSSMTNLFDYQANYIVYHFRRIRCSCGMHLKVNCRQWHKSKRGTGTFSRRAHILTIPGYRLWVAWRWPFISFAVMAHYWRIWFNVFTWLKLKKEGIALLDPYHFCT